MSDNVFSHMSEEQINMFLAYYKEKPRELPIDMLPQLSFAVLFPYLLEFFHDKLSISFIVTPNRVISFDWKYMVNKEDSFKVLISTVDESYDYDILFLEYYEKLMIDTIKKINEPIPF